MLSFQSCFKFDTNLSNEIIHFKLIGQLMPEVVNRRDRVMYTVLLRHFKELSMEA